MAAVEPTEGAFVELLARDDSGPIIAITGELDLGCVSTVRAGIDDYLVDGDQRVVFDVGKLTFMDSSGIALLVQVANRVGTVQVRNATPVVQRVLEVTGLSGVFGIPS
jgi:anti-sigma B factor antagonist